MLVLASLLLFALLLEPAKHGAKAWGIAFTLSASLVLATKFAFAAWEIGWPRFNFIGISGHTTLATLMLASTAYLLAQRSPRWLQYAAIACGMAIGMLVGASRIALHMHSFSEVVAGWALGCMAAIFFVARCTRLRPFSRRPATILVAGYALLFLIGDRPLPTQHWINAAATKLSGRDVAHYRTIPLP